MKIKLQDALDLIESADVVKLRYGDLYLRLGVFIDAPNGDPSNEVLYLVDERDENAWHIAAGENAEVDRDGHKLTLIDNEGDEVELHLFREVPVLV